jgi:hypothetical protein
MFATVMKCHVCPSGEKVSYAESMGTMKVTMGERFFPGIYLFRLHWTSVFSTPFPIDFSKTMKTTPIALSKPLTNKKSVKELRHSHSGPRKVEFLE